MDITLHHNHFSAGWYVNSFRNGYDPGLGKLLFPVIRTYTDIYFLSVVTATWTDEWSYVVTNPSGVTSTEFVQHVTSRQYPLDLILLSRKTCYLC
jgi:hypothetical protein